MNMYNANLDASEGQRRSLKQLQIDMKRWDEAEERRKARKRVEAKDIDPEEYQVGVVRYQRVHLLIVVWVNAEGE